MLTTKQIEALKPKDLQYKVNDAEQLYIIVTPHGVKSWRTNYKDKISGKYKTHTFGRFPEIGLAHARLLNNEFKDDLAHGLGKMPTLDEVNADWLKHKLPTLKNVKHKQQIVNRMEYHVSPLIGNMPINKIKRVDLVKVVKSVQDKGIIDTAHTVGTLLKQLFDYALDMGIIEVHAAAGLSRVLQKPKTENMNSILIKDAGKLFKAINDYDEPVTKQALLFAALTYVRTSELRFMEWTEIKDEKFWLIPPERMKMKKTHVVPLSDYALEVLSEVEQFTGGSKYVFESLRRPGRAISENTMLFALYRLGYRGIMTVHGFRALASTVLNDAKVKEPSLEVPGVINVRRMFESEVIERTLAHREKDEVRGAYNRADYINERIIIMNWWSDWVKSHMA